MGMRVEFDEEVSSSLGTSGPTRQRERQPEHVRVAFAHPVGGRAQASQVGTCCGDTRRTLNERLLSMPSLLRLLPF